MINNIKVTVITSLFKCERYLQGYFEAVEKIINKNECEFLLLHNAPTENELKIINSNIRNRKYFVHIVVEKREGLYSTWNRGIRMAKGKYCAIWNVDDIRFANSLVLQADILDKNSQCGLVVGDIIGTDHYGTEGYRYYSNKHKISKRNEIFKSCIITCFPMWRKSIHDDIGLFDEAGFLMITDRKKDLIITSGGKNVAPQKIENLIKSDPLFLEAIVIGDKRKYLTVLVNISQEQAERIAKEKGINVNSLHDLFNNPRFKTIVEEHIEKCNQKLARYETVKKVGIIKNEFSKETGELTATLKVKRKAVQQKYQPIIDSLYEEDAKTVQVY